MNWNAEPFYEFWDREMSPAEPVAPEPPSAWETEKQLNRLQRQVSKIKSGRLVPTVAYKLTGDFGRDLRAADTFLVGKGG